MPSLCSSLQHVEGLKMIPFPIASKKTICLMKINLIVIRTDKPEGLAHFYALLGISFEYHRHGKGSWHYSANLNQTIFEIYPLSKNQDAPDTSLRLGFEINDLDVAIANLKMNDIEVVSEPKKSAYGYFAVIRDTDGRKIELMQKSHRPFIG